MFRGGASASRLSLPEFPGDLFRDGCDHPPRSQTGYPRCSTGSVWLCCLEDIAFRQRFDFISIKVSAEDAERFLPDIDGCIFVPVHGGATFRACISPVDNASSRWTCPQTLQVFEDGNHRSVLMSSKSNLKKTPQLSGKKNSDQNLSSIPNYWIPESSFDRIFVIS